MKKDIEFLKVENIGLCIMPRDENAIATEELWDSYIINLQDKPITNVLIVSRGYGTDSEGFDRKTTTLRHFFDRIEPHSVQLIELIPTELFNFTNEYLITYTQNNYLFDKKYVFVVGSIDVANFTKIPFLEKRGVLIK